MKLAVFDATGGTGEQIVRQALAAGHQMSAFARRPEALRAVFPQLHIAHGDIDDYHAVNQAVADTDIVLSALGSRTMNDATTVYPTGTTTILPRGKMLASPALSASARHPPRGMVTTCGYRQLRQRS